MKPPPDPAAERAVRTRAYALRRGHRQLVMDHHKALGLCGLGTFGFKGEEKPMAHLMCDHVEGKGSLRRTSRCNSSWACPVCSGRRSAARAQALLPQVRAHMAAGGTCHFLTLTMAHHRGMPLGDSLDVLTKAWGGVSSGRAWAGPCKNGMVKWVRGQDVTHGRHGWHAHSHVLLLLGQGHGDGGKMAKFVLARWQEQVEALGHRVSPDKQDHQRVNDPAAAATYAVSPAAVYEPTAMAMKRARKDTGSRTPFEILESAVSGNKADASLWVEYVREVKGRKQVSCSRSLKLETDDGLSPPELDLEDEDPDAEADIVAGIGREALAELDREGLTAPLLDLVEDHAGNFDAVREAVRGFLGRLDSRNWRMFGRFEAWEGMEDARQAARIWPSQRSSGRRTGSGAPWMPWTGGRWRYLTSRRPGSHGPRLLPVRKLVRKSCRRWHTVPFAASQVRATSRTRCAECAGLMRQEGCRHEQVGTSARERGMAQGGAAQRGPVLRGLRDDDAGGARMRACSRACGAQVVRRLPLPGGKPPPADGRGGRGGAGRHEHRGVVR